MKSGTEDHHAVWAAIALLAALILLFATFSVGAAQPHYPSPRAAVRADDEPAMRRMAADFGCTLCHRDAPAPRVAAGTPLAPSWREIAARYRGGDAEAQLTRIVMEGADPAERHWKDRHDFVSMGANAPRCAPDEARVLVRWILQFR